MAALQGEVGCLALQGAPPDAWAAAAAHRDVTSVQAA